MLANAGQAAAFRSIIQSLAANGRFRIRLAVGGGSTVFSRISTWSNESTPNGNVEVMSCQQDVLSGINGFMVHGLGADELVAQALARGIPTMLHLHSLELTSGTSREAEAWMRQWNGRSPLMLVAPTENTAQRASALWAQIRRTSNAEHLPPIEVVPHGVSADLMKGADRLTGRALLRLKKKAPIVLSINRLSPQKSDYTQLLAAFSVLVSTCHEGRRLRLVMCGGVAAQDEPYVEGLRRLIKALNLRRQIVIRQHVDDEVKKHLLAASDAFVSLGMNPQESFGLALLEALKARLPLVATDWNGYREVVPSEYRPHLVPTLASREASHILEDTGDLASLTQASATEFWPLVSCMDSALRKDQVWNGLIESGRARADEYSWERTASLLTEKWDSLLSGVSMRAWREPSGYEEHLSPVHQMPSRYLEQETHVQAASRPVPHIKTMQASLPQWFAAAADIIVRSCRDQPRALGDLAGITRSVGELHMVVLWLVRMGAICPL